MASTIFFFLNHVSQSLPLQFEQEICKFLLNEYTAGFGYGQKDGISSSSSKWGYSNWKMSLAKSL